MFKDIVIKSYGRADSHSTLQLLGAYPLSMGLKTHLLLHSKEEERAYRASPLWGVMYPEPCVHVTGLQPGPGGNPRQMDWALDNIVPSGSYVMFADDNVLWFECPPDPFCRIQNTEDWPREDGYTTYSKLLHQRVHAGFWLNEFMGTCIKAHIRGASLVGVASSTLPLGRTQKYADVAWVRGKVFAMRNTGWRWGDSVAVLDEHEVTAAHLKMEGRTFVNKYLALHSRPFQLGGAGQYSQRLPYILEDQRGLLRRYPGLWRVRSAKATNRTHRELVVRLTSLHAVEAWRHCLPLPVDGGEAGVLFT